MPPASTPADLAALVDLTTTTSALLAQFQSTLAPGAPAPASSAPPPPLDPSPTDALALLADAATLLKAHTTKLSLLVLTRPFTATAVAKVLRDMAASVLPAMMGGAQQLRGGGGGVPAVVEREVRARVRRVVAAVAEEVAEVGGCAERERGGEAAAGRDALSSTGLVWEACDAVIEVRAKGVVGVVVGKVEGWRATLVDAVEELKEWGEEGGEEDEDGDEGVGSDDEDDMFGGEDKLGKGNEELRAQLDASLKKIKTVTVLYQALVKRRLKTYPGDDASVETLNRLLEVLQAIPDSVDDMASAFYDHDGEQAKKVFAKISADAIRASDIVKQSWDGKDDEFTAWSAKFRDAINA